jgi:hypothetical protein
LTAQTLRDGDHLLRTLPLAQDNLREAAAKSSMMVQLRETDVFVGQAAQMLQHLVQG